MRELPEWIFLYRDFDPNLKRQCLRCQWLWYSPLLLHLNDLWEFFPSTIIPSYKDLRSVRLQIRCFCWVKLDWEGKTCQFDTSLPPKQLQWALELISKTVWPKLSWRILHRLMLTSTFLIHGNHRDRFLNAEIFHCFEFKFNLKNIITVIAFD